MENNVTVFQFVNLLSGMRHDTGFTHTAYAPVNNTETIRPDTVCHQADIMGTEQTDAVRIMDTAFKEGWIESGDLSEPGKILRRIDAARILHLYLQHVPGIPDLPDISGAGILKDLYDCRVCVNHIAQVFLRNLMEAVKIPSGNGEVLIFASQEPLSITDSLDIIRRVRL